MLRELDENWELCKLLTESEEEGEVTVDFCSSLDFLGVANPPGFSGISVPRGFFQVLTPETLCFQKGFCFRSLYFSSHSSLLVESVANCFPLVLFSPFLEEATNPAARLESWNVSLLLAAGSITPTLSLSLPTWGRLGLLLSVLAGGVVVLGRAVVWRTLRGGWSAEIRLDDDSGFSDTVLAVAPENKNRCDKADRFRLDLTAVVSEGLEVLAGDVVLRLGPCGRYLCLSKLFPKGLANDFGRAGVSVDWLMSQRTDSLKEATREVFRVSAVGVIAWCCWV